MAKHPRAGGVPTQPGPSPSSNERQLCVVKVSTGSDVIEWRLTPWDEVVFGYPCAEITDFRASNVETGLALINEFETWARGRGVLFAYGRFDSNTITKRVMGTAGYYFAEASYRVRSQQLAKTAHFDSLIRPGPNLIRAQQRDFDEMLGILTSDFHFGRMHEDPWVSSEAAALRYRNWLYSLYEQGAEIYAYEDAGRVIGLHVQHTLDSRADLTLTGVGARYAPLAASLWALVMRLNREHGVNLAWTTISAANIPIVNLYSRFGFQVEALLLGFHKRWPPRVGS